MLGGWSASLIEQEAYRFGHSRGREMLMTSADDESSVERGSHVMCPGVVQPEEHFISCSLADSRARKAEGKMIKTKRGELN